MTTLRVLIDAPAARGRAQSWALFDEAGVCVRGRVQRTEYEIADADLEAHIVRWPALLLCLRSLRHALRRLQPSRSTINWRGRRKHSISRYRSNSLADACAW
jgi:hypothetical protein